MIPKPSKNGSAFCQKTIKIQAWRHQDRGLEGSGAGLEASWAGLGDPRRLESYLGPFWNRLGGLLAGLGPRKVANMAPTWPPKRSQNQLKIDPKIDQFLVPLGIDFWKDFGGFWMPK